MTKKVKKILWISGISLAVLIAIPVVMMTMMNKSMQKEVKKMTPLETQEVVAGVYALKNNYVNMYLIKHETGYIAVDAGNDVETISSELKKLDITADEVTDVFLTHSDADHVGAIGMFAKAKVFLSEKEEQMINGTTPRFGVFKNKLEREYTLVKDQQTMEVGGLQLQFFDMIGHTPGSMMIMVNGEYLFTGDGLGIKDGKIQNFVPMFTMDMETHLKSIETMKANVLAQVKMIFSAHHGKLEVNQK
jgi:glyoxylase-like metal-dependent hydrolase (beta-lactamase superfamily II)